MAEEFFQNRHGAFVGFSLGLARRLRSPLLSPRRRLRRFLGLRLLYLGQAACGEESEDGAFGSECQLVLDSKRKTPELDLD